jgi:hypothetical protein
MRELRMAKAYRDIPPRQVLNLRVEECGRRVHAWQLAHDLLVMCARDFAHYWRAAQSGHIDG